MENSELNERPAEEVLSQSDSSTVSVEEELEAELQEESLLDVSQSSFKPESQAINQDKYVFSKESPRTRSKIVFNIIDAQYPIVRQVGRKIFKWKLSTNPNHDWDVCWTDKSVPIETLAKMQPYQKINHFPGIQSIARKNNLGRNLMKMYKMFPKSYNFFPITYLLPLDLHEFKSQFSKTKKNRTFIIKPEANSQGRGIFLTRTFENINKNEKFVAQKYIKSPYLIDGLKFDLRIYVLLAGCDPLKVYLYEEGLGRFATEPYCQPTNENLSSTCMHLTNYAINKENPNFVFNNSSQADDVGHKKSLKAVFKILEAEGHDTKALWDEIKKIIIKVFCSVQPLLAHYYRSCHANEPYNNMCFEILGFDVMLDKKLKPWLIEVNHLPSFATDTPLDETIKRNVIRDALQIMNISAQDKIDYKNKKKEDFNQKALSRKTKVNPEEKRQAIEKAQKERDDWEAQNHGGYERIFPLNTEDEADEDYYEFMRSAGQHWQTWIGADVKKDSSKNQPKQEASQENQTSETEFQTGKRNMSPQRKKPSVSPKHSSSIQAKRTSSSKALQNSATESNSFSRIANKTTSAPNKEDFIDIKETHFGPWANGKSVEDNETNFLNQESGSRWKEEIDVIVEKHNEDEEPHLPNYKSLALTKSALAFTRPEEVSEESSMGGSSLTQREIMGSTDFISEGKSGNHSERIQNLSKGLNKLKVPSPYGLTPKKSAVKTEPHLKNTKEQKSYCPSRKLTRALSPSADATKKRVVNPNRKSTCGIPNTADANDKKEVKRLKRGVSKGASDYESEDIKESMTPFKKTYSRVLSPKRNVVNASEKIVERVKSPERLVATNEQVSPIGEMSKRISNDKDRRNRGISKDFSNSEKESDNLTVTKTPSHKPKKKKTVKKNSEEENENQPKKITLYLSKDTITRTPVPLDQENKKAWPATTTSSLKSEDSKLNLKSQQISGNLLSPQYYKIKLARDSSPVKVYEMKPNYIPKSKQKGDLHRKKETLPEAETSQSKLSILMKDLSVESTPKEAHLSPKFGKVQVQCNNFFK